MIHDALTGDTARRSAPRRLRSFSACGATALLALSLAGCGGSGGKGVTLLTRHPQWQYERYPRLVVAPVQLPPSFARQPGAPAAATQASFLLEDYIAANGNFQVLARDALKDVLTEQDLSRLADVADPSTVIPAGRIQAAQALVVGTISDYSLDAVRKEIRRPVYGRDGRGRLLRDRAGRPLIVREEVIPVFHHEARVGGSVRIIDTATSQVIYSYRSQPVVREAENAGSPPAESPQDLALDAAKELAEDLYKNIAPIQIEVELDNDMLLVALDYLDGQYEETSKVPVTLDKFLVAVRDLPKECNRNRFKIGVAPQKGRNFFEQEFVWSGAQSARGVSFEVPVAELQKAGGIDFIAKLYSLGDDEPLLTQDFKLEVPKEMAAK